jgi:23S rRNA (cytosine1962-C5)-methyltransferase
MDPPSYGRGPKGELWKIEDALFPLVQACAELLSDDPLFFLINSYTTGLAPGVLTYLISTEVVKRFGGVVDSQEVGLPVSDSALYLPCGAAGRWQAKE